MNRFLATLVLPAFLLACGGGSNPFDPDPVAPDPTPPDEENPVTDAGIPEALAGDLTRLNYDPANQTLTVEGITLDEVPFVATYRRRANLDRNGYQAYTAQNDPLDRHYTAYTAQSNNDGAVRGGVVASSGPRNRYFGGGFYERDGAYTPPDVTPTSGMVSYSGAYVGIVNIGARDDGPGSIDDLADVPATTDPALIPDQAALVDGRIFINADFADGAVEGNIYDRALIDPTTGNVAILDDPANPGTPIPATLPDLVLISTPINDDGTFYSTEVEYDQRGQTSNVIGNSIGQWGGIFGGDNASGVAGTVHLEEFDGPNNPLGLEAEEEYGTFVLDQCGQAVEDTLGCAGTNP
ncbi:MAG: thymidylate synthase [Roseovarius sp.]